MRKKLGVVPHVFVKPLVYGLGESGAKFELEYADPATIAARMRERLLDVAFLSPIDYALHAPDYSIVPGIGVSSPSGNRSLLLAFQEGLQKIQSVAVANASTSDVVAARIILGENYQVNPTFVPLRSSSCLTVEAMLTRADSALITGDESALRKSPIKCALDLTEEWNTLYHLPFVHGFWVARSNILTSEELCVLQESKDRGVNGLEEIAAEAAQHAGIDSEHVMRFLATLRFNLYGEDVESIRELFRLAFYHGVLGEVPEMRFVDTGEESKLNFN